MAFFQRAWKRLRGQAADVRSPGAATSGAMATSGSRRRLRLEALEDRTLLAVDLISASAFGGSAQRPSFNPIISNDGRFVVFESTANDLVPTDNNSPAIVDLFRRDTQTGATRLISANIAGNAGGNNSSSSPVISQDGRYIAFVSSATDLQVAIPDTNNAPDIFLRDMETGTTTLITRAITGTTAGGVSANPSISRDGRFVAFQSTAANLLAPGIDTNNASDVFVWDRQNGSITVLSVGFNTFNTAAGGSANPIISGNGAVVTFVSTATNLVFNDTNGPVQDVFARPVASGPVELISVHRSGTGSGNGSSTAPSISDDGAFVAFASLANDLVFTDTNSFQDIYVRNRTGGTALVSIDFQNAFSPNGPSASATISRNGRFVVFTSTATNVTVGDVNGGVQDVFRRDIVASQTLMVSTQPGNIASGNGASLEPVISADGRFVAFTSAASNLSFIDTNGAILDVFRRDMNAGQTVLVSFNFQGNGSGNGPSNDPVLADSGLVVPFASVASNLSTLDTNGAVQDIFLFASSNEIIVTGPDAGGGPHIRVLDARNLSARYDFVAYAPSVTTGVRVATADVTGDGVPDIITAPGRGGGPHVRVFNGAAPGQQVPGAIGSFYAYDPGFGGGLFVAAADIDRDNRADIITGADAGGGPHVRVFSGATGAVIRDFMAYPINFSGGVRVAGGDVDGDTFRDIIVSTGRGTPVNVTVFSGANNAVLRTLMPYGSYGGGAFVSGGDISVDGRADIVTGADAGGGPLVRGFSGLNGTDLGSFFAYPTSFAGGVRVGSVDQNSDGAVDIVTGSGPGTHSSLRVFTANGAFLNETFPYLGFTGGIFVAGSVPGAIGGSPLTASTDELPATNPTPASDEELAPVVNAAIESFAAAGLDAEQLNRLLQAEVRMADLPGELLGLALEDRVLIDIDAAGRGWFIDGSPSASEEFLAVGGVLVAASPEATRGIDLLTVVAHELGHVLGLDHFDHRLLADDLLADTLGRGRRRLPTAETVDRVFDQF